MLKLLLAAVLVLMASGAQAATLNVVNGQLMGASDVLVDGNLYDVQFLDGTCIDLYNGCDEPSDFTFQTEASATLASQALLAYVFLDVAAGSFDADPSLTFGCTETFTFFHCVVMTPWGFVDPLTAEVSSATNNTAPQVDGPIHYHTLINTDHSATSNGVYAVWSPVPEPSTALLVGLGLVGIAARRRV